MNNYGTDEQLEYLSINGEKYQWIIVLLLRYIGNRSDIVTVLFVVASILQLLVFVFVFVVWLCCAIFNLVAYHIY